MQPFAESMILTHSGALQMLAAAVDKAAEIGQPQCIVIVDASGETIAELRMTGAKYLSRKSAMRKARTAASIGAPSVAVPDAVRPLIGLATDGDVTGLPGGLPGGLPILRNGLLIGGIGVGSGTGEQDIAVARAALESIGADSVS